MALSDAGLPYDVWEMIGVLLPRDDVRSLRLVCSALNKLVSARVVAWKLPVDDRDAALLLVEKYSITCILHDGKLLLLAGPPLHKFSLSGGDVVMELLWPQLQSVKTLNCWCIHGTVSPMQQRIILLPSVRVIEAFFHGDVALEPLIHSNGSRWHKLHGNCGLRYWVRLKPHETVVRKESARTFAQRMQESE